MTTTDYARPLAVGERVECHNDRGLVWAGVLAHRDVSQGSWVDGEIVTEHDAEKTVRVSGYWGREGKPISKVFRPDSSTHFLCPNRTDTSTHSLVTRKSELTCRYCGQTDAEIRKAAGL